MGVVLDDVSYSEKAHRAWRLKHKDFIEMMRRKLQKQRFKRDLPPASLPA
jgi:hypothetical protein